MAQAHQDSSFELAFVPLGGTSGTARGRDLPDEIPLLDLHSTEPLPDFLPDLPLPSAPPPPEPHGGISLAALSSKSARTAPGSMWLQGDVLMCACPDCRAPMSVRLWLMVADCWKCRTSIELSEEQEREARRLLRERDESRARQQGQAATNKSKQSSPASGGSTGNGAAAGDAALSSAPIGAAAASLVEPVENQEGESQRSAAKEAAQPGDVHAPAQSPRRARKRSAAKRHVGVRAKIRKMAVVGGTRAWVQDVFGNMPAWLVSLVLHVVLLIILSLLVIEEEEQHPAILLSTEISHLHKEGGDPDAELVEDDVKFDLPVPNQDLNDKAALAKLKQADQDAKELRLDPNDPSPDLRPLEDVRATLKSADRVHSSFAARDPRMRIEVVKSEGGTTHTEAAVARALRWLASQQNDDGGWGLHGGSETAGTALALLPFLGAGQTHETGVYQDEVAMGLRWLIEHQAEDGDLRHTLKGQNSGMYAHGQGAIVLSEAYALTGDEHLRGPAQKAIDFIADAQYIDGGWRYQPRKTTNNQQGDTSVLGWQLMALHSANVSGLNVPQTTVALAGNFLDTVQTNAGARYSYLPNNRNPSPAMTAEGLLCRMYTGWTKRNPALEEGMQYLLDEHLPRKDHANVYYWYYGTQVAHHMGGEQWEKWNLNMRTILVNTQVDSGPHAGSWSPGNGDHHGRSAGRIYTTSLSTCCLEVYYRHVPLFRQIELDEPATRAD